MLNIKTITSFAFMFVCLFTATSWAGLTKTEVSQLYVSVFNRASEGEGNAFWQSLPDMATAATAMLDTQAAKDYFGANLNTNQAFIEHIYLNTLNKTIADDAAGISYWVGMLNAGTSRGNVVATLVGVIKDYAPDGQYYDPDDTATVVAFNQFINRVEVSNYMADNFFNLPDDWETSTSFEYGLLVTDDPATVDMVKASGTIIAGKVVSIADGDTVTILQNNQEYRIRLYGIDLPEKAQDFGAMAKEFTSGLVFQKDVRIIQKDVDQYGRIVGIIYVGYTCINQEIIKAGFAWVYQHYCKDSFCLDWLNLERQARESRISLWSHPDPVPPWEFRIDNKASSETDNQALKTEGEYLLSWVPQIKFIPSAFLQGF